MAAVLLLLGAGLLVLQTESGATAAAQWLTSVVNPLPNTQLTVERASGNWLRSLQLTGVTLTRPDSSSGPAVQMAHVDTLAAEYRLLPLLQGRLHVTNVSVAEPEVTLRQAADSTWDWSRVLPDTAAEPDTSAGMPIRIDRVRLTRGLVSAAFYAGGRDSTAHVRDLQLRARDIESASTVTGRLDTLGLRAQLPADTTDLSLGVRGALSATALSIDTLHLDSPRSRVRGHGDVHLPEDSSDSFDDATLQLRATPLSFRDLTPLVPTIDVDPTETVAFDLRVTGSDRRLSATLDGQFRGGGTVSAQAEATPTTTTPAEGPPLHYRLDAQVRSLTTSLLGPPDSTENRINASLTADLSGPSLTTLDGTADLQLTDTRWASLRTPQLTATTTLRDGAASLDLRGTLNDARLQMTGRTRPLDEAPNASLTARVQDLDVAAFAPDAGMRSNLSATTEIQARALGTDTQELDVALALNPSRVGVQRIEDGRLSLALRPDRARVDGRLRLPDGVVQATGTAALDGSERFALEQVRLDDVDLPAMVGDTTASRMTGTARLEGRGFSPETMQLEASLSLEDTHYGPYQLTSLSTEATLADGRVASTTDATLNGGTWRFDLAGTPFAPTPTLDLTRGRFANVDVGPLLQDTTQSSRLAGTVQGTLQGTDPSTMQLDAGLTLDSSRVNQQRIDTASLTLRLRDARADTEVSLDTPEGGTRLAATARPFDRVPTFRVTEGSFDDLNVGALAGRPNAATALSGSFTLEGRGATADSLALDAALTFDESRINDATLSEGRLSVSSERGRARLDGRLAMAGGHVALDGQIDSLDATPTYAVQTTVEALDAGALAGLDTLQARVDTLQWTLDGRGLDPATLTTATDLSAQGIQFEQFTLDDLRLQGRFRQGQLSLDTLTAHSNAFVGRGSGTLAVTDSAAGSDFSFQANVTDTQPLRRLVGAQALQLQDGTIEARIYGSSLATQRFDGEVELTGLLYDDLRLAEAEVYFNGQRGREQLFQRLEVDGTLGYLSLPSVSANRTRVDAVYDGTVTDLSANVRLDPTHNASLEAAIHTEPEETDVTLRQLNLRFEGDQWSLLREARITAGDQYRIHNLLLHSGDQQIAVDGIVDPQGTQNLVATVEALRVGAVSSLVGLSGVDGTLSGTLTLTGPATAPILKSQMSLDLQTENRDVGTLRLDAAYEDLTLTLDAALAHTDGHSLTAEGRLPVDLRLQTPTPVNVEERPVRLSLSTDQFPVDWIDPFLDPATVRDVQGTLAADVTVEGTLADPDLAGTASLSDGGASLPALETYYREATAQLRFSNDRVTLERAVVHSTNDGRLHAEGAINFPKLTVGEFDLKVNADNFIAVNTRAYRRAVVDGAMTLQGTTTQPRLGGTVQVQSADIYYNEALAESAGSVTAVPLTDEDQLTLENRFGLRLSAADTTTYDTYEALEMDLSIRIRRNTWLRSRSTPEMNVQFVGDLDLSKAPDEDPQIFGSIDVVTERSTLRQFGQEFQIEEGNLTFNGDPYTPQLTLQAQYEQRARGTQGTEVVITLRLEGRPDDLNPTLSSDPPMDTRNILSYLATGRPADQLLSGGGGSGNIATQMALGQATNFVENLAASELGLDVVRVQLRTSGASYLTVGRYVTPRFFASVEQPVTTSNLSNAQTTQYLPDLTLEYQLLDTLMLRALNTQQSLQLDFLFEYAY